MLHQHIPFATWAVVAVIGAAVVLAAFAGGVIRRHLFRLTGYLVIGGVFAFGVTAWIDGQRHAQLAEHAARAHAGSVTGALVPAFIVITLVVVVLALAVSAAAQRYRGHRTTTAAWRRSRDRQYYSERGW